MNLFNSLPKWQPKWLDSSSRQNQPIEESHTIPHLETTWPLQSLMQSDGNVQRQNISSHNNSHQPDNKLIRRNTESPSPSGNTTMNIFDDGNSININGAVYAGKGSEAYRTSLNYHQREDSNDSYHSNASQPTITDTENEARENVWRHARGNQKASGQVGQKASTSGKFVYYPITLGSSIEHADSIEHIMHSQVLCQDISRGSSCHQQGYVAQFNFVGDASDNTVDMEKVIFLFMLIPCLRIAS